MNKLFLLFLLTCFSCAHSVHQVNVSDFKPYDKFTSGKVIKAEAVQDTIMGFVYDTNYLNEARTALISKCPNGDIQGIVTRYSTSFGFFSWTNKIFMQGLCLE